MDHLEKVIKSCAKDDDSYKKLKNAFDSLCAESHTYKQRLDLLERAIRSDYDSILITELGLEKPGPKIVYANDGFTRMTGYSREEAIGKTPRILHGPKTDRAVLDKLKQRLKDGQAFFGHTVNYRKDGSEFINQWDIHPLTNSDGEITHWVSYQHDITERKRSEKKLVDTNIEFDKLTEESKKTLIDVDEQGNIVTSNKAFRDLLGYDDQELKKQKIWELLSDEHVESFRHRFDSFKPSDFDNSSCDLEFINKKGAQVEVKAKARLLQSNGQTIVRIAFENKSLQKRIMAMLSKRGGSMDAAFDQGREFRYKLEPNTEGTLRFDYVSDSFSQVTGISLDEARTITIDEIVHDEDRQKLENHLKTVLEGKPNTEQFRIKAKDGSFVEVIDYAKPDWDAERANVEAIKGAVSTEISSEKSSK